MRGKGEEGGRSPWRAREGGSGNYTVTKGHGDMEREKETEPSQEDRRMNRDQQILNDVEE